MPPTQEDFDNEIETIFQQATGLNVAYIGLNSGALHQRVGGYPAQNHVMPLCCNCMRNKMRTELGDEIIEQPPQGDGAALLIHYVLPRPD